MERETPPKSGKTARKGAAKGAKPYQRPRGGPARPVSELVPQIGRAAFRRYGFVQSSVVTRWPEIVGPTHAKVCAPESIRFIRFLPDGAAVSKRGVSGNMSRPDRERQTGSAFRRRRLS